MPVHALNRGNPSYARSRLKRQFNNTPLLCNAPANPNPSPEGKGVRLPKIETLSAYIRENVSGEVERLVTGQLPAYPAAIEAAGHDRGIHRAVNHSIEWVVR